MWHCRHPQSSSLRSFAAEKIAFALSDRDVSGAFGSGVAGVAGGALGLVLAVVIVLGRIADIEH